MQWTRVLGRLGLVSAGVGLMLAAQVARAQGGCTFTDDNGKTVFWPNCQPPTDTKTPDAKGNATTPANGQTPAAASAPGTSPAKSFPFPGETPAGQTAPAGQQNAPGSATSGSTEAPAASRFPFPGEDSSGKPGSSGSGPMKDAGSSGSSSSSSSSSSGNGPVDPDPSAGPLGDGDNDPAAKAAEARRAARAKQGIVFHQTADQREAEDLKVGAFYFNDGDYKGAYERATDAVSLAVDDADAHLALAEAARRLGKLDEAETHYRKCLALDPVPKTKKAAEKALKEMTSGG
jgi:Tetratricopeptide repeat